MNVRVSSVIEQHSAAQSGPISTCRVVGKHGHPAEMASLSVDDDVRSTEEEGGNDRSHVVLELVVNPVHNDAGSAPPASAAANMPEGHNGPRGKQPEHSKKRYMTILT